MWITFILLYLSTQLSTIYQHLYFTSVYVSYIIQIVKSRVGKTDYKYILGLERTEL